MSFNFRGDLDYSMEGCLLSYHHKTSICILLTGKLSRKLTESNISALLTVTTHSQCPMGSFEMSFPWLRIKLLEAKSDFIILITLQQEMQSI